MKIKFKSILSSIGIICFLASCRDCQMCRRAGWPDIQTCKADATMEEYQQAIDNLEAFDYQCN